MEKEIVPEVTPGPCFCVGALLSRPNRTIFDVQGDEQVLDADIVFATWP